MAAARSLPIFPLEGALLFPRGHLPLHIFEPRYRAMVADALAGERLIGMIQPRGQGETAALFDMGCIGRIVDSTELPDGGYNIVLEGVTRFRVARELDVDTLYRQVEPILQDDAALAAQDQGISLGLRSALESESRRFADQLGYQVDWEAVGQLDDETLVHLVAQAAPLDAAAKQAVLEANTLAEQTELLIQCMEFFRMFAAKGGEDSSTLQ